MSEIKNLWSKELLSEQNVVLPKTILQQQATFFNEMTKNVVTAEVKTGSWSTEDKSKISHRLRIVAPAMGNYKFDLVSILHEELRAYPVEVISILEEDDIKKSKVENADELTQQLEEIFKSERVVTALQNVIAFSK